MNQAFCTIRGFAEGTSYNITYEDVKSRNFKAEIEKLLSDFEKSLSVYDSTSIISRINQNEDVKVDEYFKTVFSKSKEISMSTGGTFDISAEPLFRAWGFSFKRKSKVNEGLIKNLMQHIGMDKIKLEGDKIIKSDPNVVLNVNAIAKGYSTDIVADFLENNNITNYLVEIGGEIRVKGLSPRKEVWCIGIDRPVDGNLIPGQDLQMLLQLTDKAIATSGNYRQFYIENGQKISHTIDPRSGYPVSHNLLCTTVIANDAMTADAYATAFMVMGIDESMKLLAKLPELDAIFIYNEDGEYKTAHTTKVEEYIFKEDDDPFSELFD